MVFNLIHFKWLYEDLDSTIRHKACLGSFWMTDLRIIENKMWKFYIFSTYEILKVDISEMI